MNSKYLQNQRAGRRVSLSNLILMGATALIGGIAIEKAVSFITPEVQERVIEFRDGIQQNLEIRKEYREAGELRFGHPARNYMERAVLGNDIGITGNESLDEAYQKIKAYVEGYSKETTDAEIERDNAVYNRVYGSH